MSNLVLKIINSIGGSETYRAARVHFIQNITILVNKHPMNLEYEAIINIVLFYQDHDEYAFFKLMTFFKFMIVNQISP